MQRLSLQGASATIGLITGLGTVVAWIVQGASSLDALGSLLWKTVLGTLLVFAGIFWLAQASSGFLDRILPEPDVDPSWTSYAIAAPLVGTAVGVALDDGVASRLVGSVGMVGLLPVALVAGLLTLLLIVVIEAVRDERAARHKTCPDCANQVLAAARKCQHCGYRFAPPS